MADPTALLTAARAHFDNMRGKSIEVPEWGAEGAPAIVKFDPPTLRTRQNITARSGGKRSREMAVTVILCARDAEGKRLFQDDAPTLAALENEVDPKVVARLYAEIIGLTSEADLGN